MKVTLEIQEQLYQEMEKLARDDGGSINAEFEKAVKLLTSKRALIRRLMNEVCDEFDEAMQRLVH